MTWETKASVSMPTSMLRFHADFNCQATRAQLDVKIPHEWRLDPSIISSAPRSVVSIFPKVLSSRELEITSTKDATALLEMLQTGTWSCEEVICAFCHRAAVAHQLVRCLMDIDLEGVIARARELDEYFKQTGKLVGPLHGLPVSIKASISHLLSWKLSDIYLGFSSRERDEAHLRLRLMGRQSG